jgi:hypothetical protein
MQQHTAHNASTNFVAATLSTHTKHTCQMQVNSAVTAGHGKQHAGDNPSKGKNKPQSMEVTNIMIRFVDPPLMPL